MRNRGFGLNDSEREVYDRLIKTFDDVLRNGIPDFVCLRNGEISFVEVKYGYGKLSEDQEKTHETLKKHGFDVRVERIPIRKHPHLYERWLVDNPADQVLSTPCQDNPDQSRSDLSRLKRTQPDQTTPNQTSPFQVSPSQTPPIYPTTIQTNHSKLSSNQKEVKKNE